MKKKMRFRKNISAPPSPGISDKSAEPMEWSYSPVGTRAEVPVQRWQQPEQSESLSTFSSDETAALPSEKQSTSEWSEQDYNELMQRHEKRWNYEKRVVDPDTGGEKGTKLARFDLVPVRPLTMLAEHYGRGATKYADRNWERGYNWSLSYAAAQRHMNQFWGGEDLDPETGTPHVLCAAWHMFSLAEFMLTHPEKDDRVLGPATPVPHARTDEEDLF